MILVRLLVRLSVRLLVRLWVALSEEWHGHVEGQLEEHGNSKMTNRVAFNICAVWTKANEKGNGQVAERRLS